MSRDSMVTLTVKVLVEGRAAWYVVPDSYFPDDWRKMNTRQFEEAVPADAKGWIPKSRSTFTIGEPSVGEVCEVEIPAWIAEQRGWE